MSIVMGQKLKADYRAEVLAGTSAWMGKVLQVNLTDGRMWVDEHDEAFYRRYIGGRGLILYYLLNQMQAGVDPLGPDNLLIFAPGLLTGTALQGSGRHAVGAKSPLTGALGSGEAGGWFGTELKQAGFDALIVRGKAESPVYLWIKDGQVEIRDAAHLWGRPTGETEEILRAELQDEKVRIAQIGPAGENLVRYASVMHDVNRAAGRSGLGAVMGSKNLKAVAVRGSVGIGMAEKRLMAATTRWYIENYKSMMGWAIASGTAGSVKYNHDAGATGIRNYQDSTLENIENLDASSFFPALLKERDTCNRCPVRCKLVIRYQDEQGRSISPQYGGPEYETIGAMGPLCGVKDPVIVAKANELCAAYGLDTISTGGTIAFTMECVEKGLLTEGPRFGDGEALVDSIHQIAYRTGPLGDSMAEGSTRMAAKLGPEAENFLAVARGQEFPLHDPRLKNTIGMGYALSATGADHMHNLNDTFANFPGSDVCARMKEMGLEIPLPLFGICAEKIEAFIYETAFKNFLDSAVICHFYPYEYRHMVEALNAAGGWDVTAVEINEIGTRIVTMARLFLLREGFTHEDDCLSPRAFYKLSSGPIAGRAMDAAELYSAMKTYFQRMGWDDQGVPPQDALNRLQIDLAVT